MLIALMAASAMAVSDILSVVLVQAEAANRGWLAGLCDTLAWYVAITTTTISVTALAGHNTAEKVWVLVLVGAANLLGTKSGQVIGQKLLKRFPVRPADPVIMPQTADLEARVRMLEARS